MDRVWCICGQRGSNSVALGYDEGSIIIKVYIITHYIFIYIYMCLFISLISGWNYTRHSYCNMVILKLCPFLFTSSLPSVTCSILYTAPLPSLPPPTLSKLGREEPAMSMDFSGKVMWARHSEVQQANLKAMGEAEIRDGEKLLLGVKDMGSCEIYPQTIQHSPNGRWAGDIQCVGLGGKRTIK